MAKMRKSPNNVKDKATNYKCSIRHRPMPMADAVV